MSLQRARTRRRRVRERKPAILADLARKPRCGAAARGGIVRENKRLHAAAATWAGRRGAPRAIPVNPMNQPPDAGAMSTSRLLIT